MALLTIQISELQHLVHELLVLGMGGTLVYMDRFRQLNKEVMAHTDALLLARASTDEEEAALCLTLLMGCSATLYNESSKEVKQQRVLDRSWKVLDKLPASLLKCQLLTYCYGEVYDEALAAEAHQIMDSWGGRTLSKEEAEVIETLKGMEENQYPNSEIEE